MRAEPAPLLEDSSGLALLGDPARGWQRQATAVVEDSLSAQLQTQLGRFSICLLVSQQGPFAGRLFTVLPVSLQLSVPSHLFRALALRRLRLPFPISDGACRRRRRLDPFGDYRAAGARVGLLRSRGCPLERAADRVCRKARARVTVNSRLADMNLPVDRLDDRRLEVVANPPALWSGAQVAVDTTLSSPLSSSGADTLAALTGPPCARLGAKRSAALPAVTPCRLVARGKKYARPSLVSHDSPKPEAPASAFGVAQSCVRACSSASGPWNNVISAAHFELSLPRCALPASRCFADHLRARPA